MVNIREAAEILSLSTSSARLIMGEPTGHKKIKTGHNINLWARDEVIRLRNARDAGGAKAAPAVKLGTRYNKNTRFQLDPAGNVIPLELRYRGSICRHEGCNNPVPTGYIFCLDHEHIFKKMQERSGKLYGEQYEDHSRG